MFFSNKSTKINSPFHYHFYKVLDRVPVRRKSISKILIVYRATEVEQIDASGTRQTRLHECIMNEAMDTLKKERTGGRRSGVCSVVSGRSALLVAVIWTVRMAVAPVDILDALVPGGAFELARRAFPLCILFCSADICAKNIHIFTHIYNHSVYIYV